MVYIGIPIVPITYQNAVNLPLDWDESTSWNIMYEVINVVYRENYIDKTIKKSKNKFNWLLVIITEQKLINQDEFI